MTNLWVFDTSLYIDTPEAQPKIAEQKGNTKPIFSAKSTEHVLPESVDVQLGSNFNGKNAIYTERSIILPGTSPVDGPVVAKVLFATTPKELDRAKNEAEAQLFASTVSEYVPLPIRFRSVHGAFRTESGEVKEGNLPVIESEAIDGVTYDNIIKKRGPLGFHKTLDQLETVAQTLDAFHDAGRLHLDVKPQNMMINNQTNNTHLVDFGSSQKIGDKVTPLFEGSPAYVAPEQCRVGAELTEASDVWGFAATAYYSITGEKLMPGKLPPDPESKLVDKESYDAYILSKLESFSPPVQEVFKKALYFNPQYRYTSCQKFLKLLDYAALTSDVQPYTPEDHSNKSRVYRFGPSDKTEINLGRQHGRHRIAPHENPESEGPKHRKKKEKVSRETQKPERRPPGRHAMEKSTRPPRLADHLTRPTTSILKKE